MLVLGTLASAVPANAEKFWIAILGNSATEVGYGIGVDSNRNVYTSFRSNSSGNYRCSLAKYDKNGSVQWQKQVSFNNHQGYYENDVTADSSGNVYALSTVTDGYWGGLVTTKYTTDGTITWQRAIGTDTDSFIDSIAVDPSGNVAISGPINNYINGYTNTVVKYNSSGTVQWKKYLSGGPSTGEGHGVAVDSSGNVYGGGFGGGAVYGLMSSKFDSSGSLQWLKKFNAPASYDAYGGRLAADASGNVYQVGLLRAEPTVYQSFLIKRNSSGTLQWQRKLSNSSSSYGIVPMDVTTDSAGNIYTTNYTAVSSVTTTVIAKWNSSGTLQWQRSISGSGGVSVGKIRTDSLGSIYIIGTTNVAGNSDAIAFKLPGDGSLTGTYSVGSWSITYAASSVTEAAGDGSDGSHVQTASDNGISENTPSHSIANTSFTSTVKTL